MPDNYITCDGAVTLGQLHELGWQTAQIFSLISRSLGIESDDAVDFLEQFELDRISRELWVFDPDSPEF